MPSPSPIEAPETEEGIPADSLVRTLTLIGDVWTVLLLKEFFSGQHRFQDLQARLQIPRQTLMLRLAALTAQQVLWKKPVQRRMVQYEYHLTPKGLDLYPFVLAVWAWHRRWQPRQPFLPAALAHRPCGQALRPEYRCAACAQPVRRCDVVAAPGAGAGLDPRPPARLSRQNDAALLKPLAEGEGFVATSIVGDRWSFLVLHALFQGTSSFFALCQGLRISSNILSGRLKKLAGLGLIAPEPAGSGRRIDYRVTPQGEDLWPVLHALTAWGDRWLAGPEGPPMLFRHHCGALLEARFCCAACNGAVRAWDVTTAA